MQTFRIAWAAVAAAIALAGIAIGGHVHHAPAHRDAHRAGELSSSQILDRAGGICAALIPANLPVRITAERLQLWRRHRPSGHIWNVECDDARSDLVAFLTLTPGGDLLGASVPQGPPAPRRIPALTRRQAWHTACAWLGAARLAGAQRPSRLIGADLDRAAWTVDCGWRGGQAFVIMDAYSGELIALWDAQSAHGRALDRPGTCRSGDA